MHACVDDKGAVSKAVTVSVPYELSKAESNVCTVIATIFGLSSVFAGVYALRYHGTAFGLSPLQKSIIHLS